jgi:hypothetical protein
MPNESSPSLAFAAHLLAQYDGATIVGKDGSIKRTGIHLIPSQRAESLIPIVRGTRHTSARRASFDHANALFITVSADGPVTIFSDGMSVFELNWSDGYEAARVIRGVLPKEAKDNVWTSSHDAVCAKCGKTSKVETVTIAGHRTDEEATCPICGDVIATDHCWEIHANLKKFF